MSSDNVLDQVKKLREITGVGFSDCKKAIDENHGDIEKSILFLRKKGISKANQKQTRIAADGVICIHEEKNVFSMVEINTETDFVAKNENFIKFAEEVSKIVFLTKGDLKNTLSSQMGNKRNVEENLVDLISKIGEKITIRRSAYFEKNSSINFSYMHTSIKKNVGKLGVLLSLETSKPLDSISDLGHKLSMHIAASSPVSIDKNDLNNDILNKEREIIKEELKNSGKDTKIIDKIALGKLNKFVSDNTLLNQEWIMEPKKKVKDIIKEHSSNEKIKIKKFIRFKVGEGI